MLTTETLGQDVNTLFRATIKTCECCNLKSFWYLYCYIWSDFTLFSYLYLWLFHPADEIKQRLARYNFYTIQNQLMEVVFEIATNSHRKFSVKKVSATLLKRDSNAVASCEAWKIFKNTYLEENLRTTAFWLASRNILAISRGNILNYFSFKLMIYTHFFISNTSISNARLKLAKNQAKLNNILRLNFC